MLILSIDGASRRNGKPDCVSTGAIFIKYNDIFGFKVVEEIASTNQRGEITALLKALSVAQEFHNKHEEPVYLVTDSEYVFNTVTKDWVGNWVNKDWITSSGQPVKNRDLWEHANNHLIEHIDTGVDMIVFHIKGHIFPFGKRTAEEAIEADPTGEFLYKMVKTRLLEIWDTKEAGVTAAKELFLRNNGVYPDDEAFFEMVVCNTVADLIAGWHADKLDL